MCRWLDSAHADESASSRCNGQGWADTSMRRAAGTAGVSTETVHGGFGSKRDLLAAVSDVAVVGNDLTVRWLVSSCMPRRAMNTLVGSLIQNVFHGGVIELPLQRTEPGHRVENVARGCPRSVSCGSAPSRLRPS